MNDGTGSRHLGDNGIAAAYDNSGKLLLGHGRHAHMGTLAYGIGHRHIDSRQFRGGIVGFYPHIGQDLGKDSAHHRGRHGRAVQVGLIGFIQDEQYRYLGVIHRGHTYKGVGVVAAVGIQLLTGAGLAADAVSRYGRVFTGAVGHNTFHQFAHLAAGFLADDLAADGRFGDRNHIAFAVQYLIHHIGLIQVAAVYRSGDSGDELNGRHLKALAEGGRFQVALGGIELCFAVKIAALLARQVNTGGLGESERGKEIIEIGSAYPLTNLHIGGVTAVLHSLRQCLQAVAGMLPAVLYYTARHIAAGTVKAGLHRHRTGFQRRGRGDDLKYRARLVGLIHCLIAPLDLLLVGKGLLILIAALLVLGQLLQGDLRNDGLRIIGIIVRHGGHAQDRPGVHILHNDCRAVLYRVLGQSGGQVLFYHRLNIAVQRQHQAIAVLRLGDILVGIWHIGAPGVFGSHYLAGSAA